MVTLMKPLESRGLKEEGSLFREPVAMEKSVHCLACAEPWKEQEEYSVSPSCPLPSYWCSVLAKPQTGNQESPGTGAGGSRPSEAGQD